MKPFVIEQDGTDVRIKGIPPDLVAEMSRFLTERGVGHVIYLEPATRRNDDVVDPTQDIVIPDADVGRIEGVINELSHPLIWKYLGVMSG